MRIFLIIASLVFTVLSGIILYKEGFSTEGMIGFILFLSAALVFTFQNKLDQWTEQRIKAIREETYCIIKHDHIYFPKGYYFKQGFLKSRKDLPFDEIEEIRLNTIPITAKIKHNEIIFLKGLSNEDIMSSVLKEKEADFQDHWALICEEFLDTELEEEEQERIQNRLTAHGFSIEEIKRIKDRIRLRMLIRTYASWEWVYYGQFDVLSELWPLSAKKYWWTMDIALRTATKISKTNETT
ncbi:hypothetical protein KFE94_16940 [bacterium SCSIO 12643]|nr:hypothetical protein KFE94_16940 [bacterium SCSIO 12643]